jgi:hypothetical protein
MMGHILTRSILTEGLLDRPSYGPHHPRRRPSCPRRRSDHRVTGALPGRYYDPATGQFLSVDPAAAVTGSPFGYVDDNPVNG